MKKVVLFCVINEAGEIEKDEKKDKSIVFQLPVPVGVLKRV